MSDEYGDSNQDDMRLCPVCRTPISVWATRCRFCGEEVGRPRKEEETKTIEDLGGQRSSNYTISGNVKDALEAFRAEELADLNSDDTFGDAPETPATSALPELDEKHAALAEAVTGGPIKGAHASKKKPARPVIDSDTRNMLLAGGAVIALIVIGILAWPSVRAWLDARNQVEEIVYDNRAREMLASGASPVEALQEAHDALKINDTDENRAILTEVREAVVARVETLLSAPRFSQATLDEASNVATRAGYLDSSSLIRNLKETVDKEVAAHQMVLLNIDEAGQQATFRVNNRYFPEAEQTVGVGDLVQDRFIVQKIATNFVRVADTMRQANAGPRTLMCRELNSVSAD